jgi:hypothetical protein
VLSLFDDAWQAQCAGAVAPACDHGPTADQINRNP